MVHLRNTSYSPREASELLSRARNLVPETVIVRDARVSKKYVEFDISIPDELSLEDSLKQVEKISALVSYDHIVERHLDNQQAISKAIEQFNDEKYWSAHEALEQVWKRSSGTEKDLINGIILIAAAFVHDEKDEQDVCLSILQRASIKLERCSGNYHGIDIDLVKSQLTNIIHSGTIVRFRV